MPYGCFVPLCNGNYKNGPKVSVYSFPKDEHFKRLWCQAVKRKDSPKPQSKVCELHFEEGDFIREARGFNEKTGKEVVVRLKIKRLKKEAVPSKFFDAPHKPHKTQKKKNNYRKRKIPTKESDAASKAFENCGKVNEAPRYSGCLEDLDLQDLETASKEDQNIPVQPILKIKEEPTDYPIPSTSNDATNVGFAVPYEDTWAISNLVVDPKFTLSVACLSHPDELDTSEGEQSKKRTKTNSSKINSVSSPNDTVARLQVCHGENIYLIPQTSTVKIKEEPTDYHSTSFNINDCVNEEFILSDANSSYTIPESMVESQTTLSVTQLSHPNELATSDGEQPKIRSTKSSKIKNFMSAPNDGGASPPTFHGDYHSTSSNFHGSVNEAFILSDANSSYTMADSVVESQSNLSLINRPYHNGEPNASDIEQTTKTRNFVSKIASHVSLTNSRIKEKCRDNFDVFGEFIADQLRNLDLKSSALAQKAMENIIFEAKMGKFLNQTWSSRS